ncbi:pentapeptide repeat-containing protein [Nocardia carnea]|uniref:Pentapeptide repeat-containing protein n=1 Tax=Nocardia carnea TaxID=37328 RepID=A0ABW7TT49_9NOCA|nr:pentapeptide repeat-containing protein [Nocardia carnea]
MPRELADLPFAPWLEPVGDLDVEREYDCARFEDMVLAEPDLRSTVFGQCAFRSVHIDHGVAGGARFADVWLHGVRFTGTDMPDAAWMDAEVIDGAWSGVESSGAELRRVVFHNCKLDSVNFRNARLTKVRFVDCVLRHVDFGSAKLSEVSFPGSEVSALTVRNAQLKKVDFRRAHSIGIADGVESLRGALVTPGQLLDLAPTLAAAVGLVVEE